MAWGTAFSKFEHLAAESMSPGTRERIIERVERLEVTPVVELCQLLGECL